MKKSRIFIEGLYKSEVALQAYRFNWLIIIVMLFSVIMMSSLPSLVMRYEFNSQLIDEKFPDIYPSFVQLYEDELDCKVDDQAKLVCKNPQDFKAGKYNVTFKETDTPQPFTIYLMDDQFAVSSFVDNEHQPLVGTYNLLHGFDFSKIKSQKPSDVTNAEYYLNITNEFLKNVYLSTYDIGAIMAMMMSFLQIMVYIPLMAALLVFGNKGLPGVPESKLKYKDAIKIIVYLALTPALITAMVSFVWPTIGAYTFLMLFAIRIIMVYFKRLKMLQKQAAMMRQNRKYK